MLRVKSVPFFLMGFLLLGSSQTFGGEEQGKLIEGAKKEGKVVYWSSGLTPRSTKAIEEGFKKKYGLHEFQVVYAPTRTAEQIAKVTQELKVRKLTVDIICGGMPEFFYELLKAGELMKYESPEYKYFPMIEGVNAEPGYWVATMAFSSTALAWNPKFVKKDIVKYADLLDPQFKGLICSLDARKSESGLSGYFGSRKILGKDFFLGLAKQDIFWLGRTPDVAHKVTTGERPVAFLGSSRSGYDAAAAGAEIKLTYPKEGVVILSMPFIFLAKAPHPNAAKLLIDYVHSTEGQKIISDDGYFAGRKDVPISPKVMEYIPPISKINVIRVDWKSVTEEEIDKARREFQEIFGK